MNMIDAISKLQDEDVLKRWLLKYDPCVEGQRKQRENIARHLDELTGHSRAVEACRAVIETDEQDDRCCHLCSGRDFLADHADACPVRLCEAVVADADK